MVQVLAPMHLYSQQVQRLQVRFCLLSLEPLSPVRPLQLFARAVVRSERRLLSHANPIPPETNCRITPGSGAEWTATVTW